jgi:hypothetical protein
MNKQSKLILASTLFITLASLMTWQLTGGDYYTKFQVVEEIDAPFDPSDPLAAAGFYDDRAKQTVVRDEFRLGLLPTPSGLFDKHLLSVASIVAPVWMVALALLWRGRRQTTKYK